jgi:hypothetical protein
MAPYGGKLSDISIYRLKFSKIREAGLYQDGTLATGKMIAHQGMWNFTIPRDIASRICHELLALQFCNG